MRFYNQLRLMTVRFGISTPTIGMLGVIEDKKHITSLAEEN